MADRDTEPGSNLAGTRWRPRLFLALLLVLSFVVTSCGILGGDEDADNEGTVAPALIGDATLTPASTRIPEQAPDVQTDSNGWTIITAPEAPEPPASLAGDQVLRLAGTSESPTSIDPALVRDAESSFISRQVFRGLMRIDSDLEPVPDLAKRVEVSPDGLTYRFTLRDDLTFHDGAPIGAEQVKASFERATDPALTGGNGADLTAQNYLSDIEGAEERMAGERSDIPGITVVDENTVEFRLERGVADFLERLAGPPAYIVDVEDASSGGDWWKSPNGSGPFQVEEWDPTNAIRLVPHDGYVRPPMLNEVVIRLGRAAVGEVQLYENGEIDVANVGSSLVDRFNYEGSPYYEDLRVQPLLSTTFVMINPNMEPFDDPQIREALLRGFPRTPIPNVMFDGRMREAHGMLPPEMQGSEVAFPYSFDQRQARSILDSAASTGGAQEITIFTSGGSIPAAMKRVYDEHGLFQTEVVQLRWPDYLDDLEARELPVFVLTWIADGPDPVSFLRSLFHSESPNNYSGFSNPEVDQLLDQAMVEQDEEQRAELLSEAHRLILESAVVMPLYHGVDYMLVAPHVNGLTTTPMGILGLETVWIEQ